MTLPFLQGFELARGCEDWVRCLRESSDASERAEDYETRPAPDRLTHRESALRPEQGSLSCGISIAWRRPDGLLRSCYVGYRHDPRYAGMRQPDAEHILQAYRDNCNSLPANVLRVAHNGVKLERGIDLREHIPWPLPGQGHDTLVAYRITNRGVGPKDRLGLKELRGAYLKGRGYDESKSELDTWLTTHGFKPGADIWHAPIELAGQYGAGDTCSTLELWEDVKPLVYRPWRWPDEFGWWWERGYFDLSGGERGELGPNGPELADLYDLEMEAAYQALLASQRGTRFDGRMAARRRDGATRMQHACAEWVRARVLAMQEELGPMAWVCARKMSEKQKEKLTPEKRAIVEQRETEAELSTDLTRFNPNAPAQIKRLMFGDGATHAGLSIPVDTRFMSKKFNQMNGGDQERAIADPVKVRTYAQVSIDAMKTYSEAFPQHQELFSVIGVLRKTSTVLQWAKTIPDRYAIHGVTSRWWDEDGTEAPTQRIYHQVGTVQTTSGRMSSSSYNGTNCSASKALRVGGRKIDKATGETIVRSVLDILREHHGAEFVADLIRTMDVLKDDGVDFGIRCLFLADEEHAGRPIDLSQIEVRIFAGLTGNQMLCHGYGKPPTDPQVTTELSLLRAMGGGTLDTDGYLSQCVLDPLRHWHGTPIDAHSLVTAMTTLDHEIQAMGLAREDYDDVLQLCAADEDRAILRVLHARGAWRSEDGRGARDLSREEMQQILKAIAAADRGDAETLIKLLVAARKSKKSITFGIMYGMGVPKLARSLGMTIEEARAFLADRYYAAFPEAKTIPRRIEAEIVKRANESNGWKGWMRHPAGRRFTFDVIYDHLPWRSQVCPTKTKGKKPSNTTRPCSECKLTPKGSYKSVNEFCQGLAAGLFKGGFVRGAQLLTMPSFGRIGRDKVTRRFYGNSWVDREIHDENIFMLHRDVDDARTDYAIRSGMTLFTRVGTPLETSSERFQVSWEEKHEVKYASLNDR